jgi:erythromycin esterase
VGESVHNVQEFMEFRFELLKDLVQHHRVTAVIVESGMPEAMAVNDYVQGRTDTVNFETALGPDYNEAQVVRGALRWLRDWNLGPGRAHPVAFYGADMSIGDGRSMIPALDRLLAVVDHDRQISAVADSIRPIASRLSAGWWNGAVQNYRTLPPDAKTRIAELAPRLVSEARRWSDRARNQDGWAVRFALIVQQIEVMLRNGPFSAEAPRDAAMAANTKWLTDRLPAGERAVFWAHNAHVQRTLIKGSPMPIGPLPSMGYRLGLQFGKAYVAIGTAYGGASMDSAAMPIAGSVDATLATLRREAPFAVSLREAPQTGDLAAWLQRERPMRFQVGHLQVALGAAFDLVVYFDSARPIVKAQ